MEKTRLSKLICLLLAAVMVLSMVPVASAADVTVNIVSFTRGEQTNLRASELLEARVEGYDGNVRDLTYVWTNGIGTYLYVFNDHNMYGINGTEGEVEIYNDEVDSSANMAGRSYDTKFSGQGFAWAAIYGANINSSDLLGSITVTVKDANGNVLATDTHTGTRTGRFGRYVYSGFVVDDLDEDLHSIAFGIFEGDAKQIRELFSESSIVHITCVESSVSKAKVNSGKDNISLTQNSDGTYTVTALQPGTSVIAMDVEKGNCKFHQYSSGSTTTTVHIYKKPVATPTTTTISLSNLDDNCTYYIDGVEGINQGDGTVLFTGLTPNTTYTIEAKGHVDGTEPVYAYTSATTLPVYNATVKVYLDGGMNADGTAYGTPVNISDIRDTDDSIYVKATDSTVFYQLTHTETGVYTAGVPNGTYNIYRDAEEDSNPSTQQLIIYNADGTRYLFYYTVSYDANGGTGAPATSYVYEGNAVTLSETVPPETATSSSAGKLPTVRSISPVRR